jgi:hypothetical protein
VLQSQLDDDLICVFTRSPGIILTLMTPKHARKGCTLQQQHV